MRRRSATTLLLLTASVVLTVPGCTSATQSEAPWQPTTSISTGVDSSILTQQSTFSGTDFVSPLSSTAESASPEAISEVTESSTQVPSFMPDLVGLSEEDAKAQLIVYNVRIRTSPLISPQSAGTVVDQDPVAGSQFSQSVTLTVSVAPPPVPDVKQQDSGAASMMLKQLGFTVREEPVFNEKLADGLIMEQSPPVGTANASEVVLKVVRRPFVVYLNSMAPVALPKCQESGYECLSWDSQKANAKSYSHAIRVLPKNGLSSTWSTIFRASIGS